jgi:hypothetical protein
MLLDRLNRYVPAQDRVALGAVGPVLAAMNIRVAVCAILAHLGKDRFGVALCAIHFFVHPPERISSAVVVELRNGANGAPTGAGVTIFAGD